MDGPCCVLDHSPTLGNSISLRTVCKAANIHDVDDCDVPDRLGHLARIAGARVFRMGDTHRSADATVRIRSDATPIDSTEGLALGKAKADRQY